MVPWRDRSSDILYIPPRAASRADSVTAWLDENSRAILRPSCEAHRSTNLMAAVASSYIATEDNDFGGRKAREWVKQAASVDASGLGSLRCTTPGALCLRRGPM